MLTKELSGKCFCFGDSLFSENVDLIEDFIENQTCNGAVVRLGSYSNNLTELDELTSYIKGNFNSSIFEIQDYHQKNKTFSKRPGSAQHFSGRWWTSPARESSPRVITKISVAFGETVQQSFR